MVSAAHLMRPSMLQLRDGHGRPLGLRELQVNSAKEAGQNACSRVGIISRTERNGGTE